MMARLVTPATVAPTVSHSPDLPMVIGAGALAVLLAMVLFSIAGHAITIVHEGGHAAMTVLLGGRVHSVRLNRDRTGLTHTSGRGGADDVLISLAGYLAPSVFGLLGVLVLVHGQPAAVLWASLALLVLLLLLVRNLFGLLSVLALGLVLFLAVHRGSSGVQLLVACTWVWFLLLGGALLAVQHRVGGGDHHNLRAQTRIPARFWGWLTVLLTGTALVYGGMLLVGAVAAPI